MSRPASPPYRRWSPGGVVAVVLGVVLAVGAVATASLLRAPGTVATARGRAPALLLAFLLTAGFTLANLAVRWIRWQGLVRRAAVTVPTREGFRLYAMTLPAIATPFSLGELLRAVLLRHRRPGAGPAVGVVWVLERTADAAAMGALYALLTGRMTWVAVVAVTWMTLHVGISRMGSSVGTGGLGSPTSTAFTAACSLMAWSLPAGALVVTADLLSSQASASDVAAAFCRSTLLGGLTGLPLGTGVTGVTLATSLRAEGLAPAVATLLVAAFRAGTSWLAVGLGVAALARWRRRLPESARAPGSATAHFDRIAGGYAAQLPGHVQHRLLRRKTAVMLEGLGARAVGPGARGLEVGCGHGWYAREMAREGYPMTAFDVSTGQVAEARVAGDGALEAGALSLCVADGTTLPYRDCAFDFAYAVNVLHHITLPEARRKTLEEIVRVLRPGAPLFLHEMNVTNPLFRLYLDYLYPLVHDIDDGTEVWVHPRRLPPVAGARWSTDLRYFTFLPEFLPAALDRRLASLERRLESSSLSTGAAHFAAVLVKDPQPPTRPADAPRAAPEPPWRRRMPLMHPHGERHRAPTSHPPRRPPPCG